MVRDVATGAMRVGRFGWKAQHATLLTFSADAYRNEIGITSRLFPVENAPNGNHTAIAHVVGIEPDDKINPTTGKGDIDMLEDFMRFLGPPPRAASSDTARAGERIFQRIDCASCHTPSFITSINERSELSLKRVEYILIYCYTTWGLSVMVSSRGTPARVKCGPLHFGAYA